MINNTIDITKEMGSLLADIRKKAHLTQKEVGERLGFSSRSGRVYVSRLEKGGINNPSLWLILQYLTVCEKPWSSLFEKLAGIYFNKQHDKIIAQVPTTRFYKKIDRDVAKYEHSIDSKFSIKLGVKPLSQEQKEKMAKDFGRYRANIEPIEREITILLGDSGEPIINNQYYKAFARECYSALQKITALREATSSEAKMQARNNETTKEISADSALSAVKINQIIDKWVEKGLKREILEQIKAIPIKYFKPQVDTDKH
jgi:transcriptional regulator with XRE-family HTH domain